MNEEIWLAKSKTMVYKDPSIYSLKDVTVTELQHPVTHEQLRNYQARGPEIY